jgi:hypothetical protein
MIEALEDPHLAEHAFLVALDLLLRYGLQGDLKSDGLRDRIGTACSARRYGGRLGAREAAGLTALDVPCGALV